MRVDIVLHSSLTPRPSYYTLNVCECKIIANNHYKHERVRKRKTGNETTLQYINYIKPVPPLSQSCDRHVIQYEHGYTTTHIYLFLHCSSDCLADSSVLFSVLLPVTCKQVYTLLADTCTNLALIYQIANL